MERRRRLGGRLRKAAVAIGVGALAWIAVRRVRSGNGVPGTDEVRERTGEVLPDAVAERVGTAGEAEDEQSAGGTGMDFGGDRRAGSSGPQPDQASSVDATMGADEMAERVEPDADEEPAPPGEMNVDDEVAEEVLGGEGSDEDDGSLEEEEDMLGQDETDMEGDEDEET